MVVVEIFSFSLKLKLYVNSEEEIFMVISSVDARARSVCDRLGGFRLIDFAYQFAK